MDKAKQLNDPQLEMMEHFADFLIEIGRHLGDKKATN